MEHPKMLRMKKNKRNMKEKMKRGQKTGKTKTPP